MYTFFRLIKKPTKRFLLVAVLLCGALVYAMVDQTVYTTEQLVIIPGEVSSTDWDGLGSVLVQDLDDAALYQEFGKDNAAYLREGQTTPAVSESDSNATTDSDDSAGDVTATSTDGGIQEEDSGGESEVILDNGSTESSPSVEETIPVEDLSDTPPPPEESASVWGVFPYDRAEYPLAQFDETESIVLTEESVSAAQEISDTNEVADEQPTVVDVVPEVTEPAAETDMAEEASDAEIEAEAAETITDMAAEEQNSDDQTELVTEDGLVAETVSEDTIDSVATVSNTIFDLPVPCTSEDNCVTKSMVLSGFTVPEFESGVRLDGAQLRMSLGAQLIDANRSEVQRFVIEYTYALGDQPTWEVASVVDITDEISNSLNGGYQLISIPTPRTPGELSALRVRLSYQGVEENLRDIYLDGVWLEVTSGHFYERDDFSAITDEIEYERSLEAPKMHELLSEDTDVGLNTLPSFSLAYDPQENFLRRVFNWVFSENSFSVDTVTLVDAAGVAYKIPFEVVYNNTTEWTIKFLEQPQKLRVGKYRVVVDVLENDQLYRDSFEFYWGVLAVNTTKSMYFSGEKVVFNLAALTDEGETICNADLRLKIISPSNTIHEVPVNESGSCNKNNVTDTPDYLAEFSGTEENGAYQVQLQHFNKDGELVHKVADRSEVREYIPYDITRTAPTRI